MLRVVWLLLLAAHTTLATNNERTCIKNTGARCITGCYSWRGPAYCKYSRCFCQENACAGSDDICHTGTKKDMKDVASGQAYELRNARWPEFHLRAGGHGPLTAKRKRGSNSDQYKWTLREPPRAESSTANEPIPFLIYSKYWPDAVTYIRQRVACSVTQYNEQDDPAVNLTDDQLNDFINDENNTNGTLPEGYVYQDEDDLEGLEYDDPESLAAPTTNPNNGNERRLSARRRYYGGGTDVNCQETRRPIVQYVHGAMYGLGTDPPLHWLLNYFVRAPKVHLDLNPGIQLVMIRNSQASYLFMPNFDIYGFTGWGVRGYYSGVDPGASGYWIFEPPLPTELWDRIPAFSGRTCSIMCGEVSPQLLSIVNAAPGFGSKAFLAAWAAFALTWLSI